MRCSVLLLLLLVSCCPCRHAAQRDSIAVVVKERVIKQTDTVQIEIPKEVLCNVTRDTVSVLINSVAQSTAVVTGGVLRHDLTTIPRAIKKPVTIQTTVRDSIVYKDKVQTIEVNVLTRWQKIKMEGFWLLLSIFLLVAGFKISRFF